MNGLSAKNATASAERVRRQTSTHAVDQRRGGETLVEEPRAEERAPSTSDAAPDNAVNAGPYTDGVWCHARPTCVRNGLCG